MSIKHFFGKSLMTTSILSITVLLLIVAAIFLITNQAEITSAQGAEQISGTNSGDDYKKEVGIEWVNDTRGDIWDTSFNDDSCNELASRLINEGWGQNFAYTDNNAYETDLKDEMYGGYEDFYVDSVDLALVCIHSIVATDQRWQIPLDSLFFGTRVDDNYLTPGDAFQAYGDQDLEWLAFDASSILSDQSKEFWALSMKGLHLLLGFQNYRVDNYFSEGGLWARFMTGFNICSAPHTVMQAWFLAVDYSQPEDVCARVISHGYDSFNDYLTGEGYVNPDPSLYTSKYYFDHCSTGVDYGGMQVNPVQPEIANVPVVEVVQRVVDEDYLSDTIMPAFDLENEPICFDGEHYAVSQMVDGITRTLTVDKETGSYSFQNLGKLWVSPHISPTLPAAVDAAQHIDDWIRNTPALNLPAIGYRSAGYEYLTEEIVELNPANNVTGVQNEINKIPVDVAMTYPRQLTLAAGTSNGIQQVNFPVFGPGGRLKIYLGDGGEIIGAQGGSRDVRVTTEIVNILDPDLLWDMYLADHGLALGEISYLADTITHITPTLGYYEMAYLIHQNELIPVWKFPANFYAEGNLLGENVPVYLPAANKYLPPQAAILNPADGSSFRSGEAISFKGSITGGTPPYAVKWSSSKDGILGDTIDIIAALSSTDRDGRLFIQDVSFQVIDANGLSDTATISLIIKPLVWLPMIIK